MKFGQFLGIGQLLRRVVGTFGSRKSGLFQRVGFHFFFVFLCFTFQMIFQSHFQPHLPFFFSGQFGFGGGHRGFFFGFGQHLVHLFFFLLRHFLFRFKFFFFTVEFSGHGFFFQMTQQFIFQIRFSYCRCTFLAYTVQRRFRFQF